MRKKRIIVILKKDFFFFLFSTNFGRFLLFNKESCKFITSGFLILNTSILQIQLKQPEPVQ